MVYILLGSGFEEAEALVPADLLRRGGAGVVLTGVGGATVSGSHGITVAADRLAQDVQLMPGDALVLPGGMGGVASLEGSPAAMALIRQAAAEQDVWLAAICAAPTLLARAGLLRGRRAVCYPGMEDQLAAGGALFEDAPFVLDGKLLTGRAAGAAFDFALALLELLTGPQTAAQVRQAVVYRP